MQIYFITSYITIRIKELHTILFYSYIGQIQQKKEEKKKEENNIFHPVKYLELHLLRKASIVSFLNTMTVRINNH